MFRRKPIDVSIQTEALERCFLFSEILRDQYDRPFDEYALVGLADIARPTHICSTLVLPGQQISPGRVSISGHQVLQIRPEVHLLSDRLGMELVPVAFIHRHPGAVGLSGIDIQFLTEIFINQVAAVTATKKLLYLYPEDLDCRCMGNHETTRLKEPGESIPKAVLVECAVSFSIVVNHNRDYAIEAARLICCPGCGQQTVNLVPAELHVVPEYQLTEDQRQMLRGPLEVEIDEKLAIENDLVKNSEISNVTNRS